MSCALAPAGAKNAVPGCPANSRCSWPPFNASITAIPSGGTAVPLMAATVWVRGDDEQVTLRLETSMDWDFQVAIKVIKHVEAMLLDELAERCCGHTGSSQ